MARHPIQSAIFGIFDDIRRARKAQTTYSRLSLQSDSALAARGLRREDLAAYSFNQAYND